MASSKSQDSKISTQAKLKNFYIALYNENNPIQAENILNDVSMQSAVTNEVEYSLAQQALAIFKGGKPEQLIQRHFSKEAVTIVPDNFEISQNYPNPFNPTTKISYQLSGISAVSLKVYDILGREVATLTEGIKEAGNYTANFDGSKLSSGVYFMRFFVNPQDGSKNIVKVKKMLLAK